MTDKFTEKEYVSKCCGGRVELVPQYDLSAYPRGQIRNIFVCAECIEPCQVIEKSLAKEE